MLYLNSCPRCSTGDVELASDSYGAFFQCLQCGWVLDLPSASERMLQKTVASRAVSRARRTAKAAA